MPHKKREAAKRQPPFVISGNQSLLFPVSQDFHAHMTALAHRPFGAELLAAEAVDADPPVDLRFAAFHGNRLRRADLRALAAAHAAGGELREGRQYAGGGKVRAGIGDEDHPGCQDVGVLPPLLLSAGRTIAEAWYFRK